MPLPSQSFMCRQRNAQNDADTDKELEILFTGNFEMEEKCDLSDGAWLLVSDRLVCVFQKLLLSFRVYTE